jgi:hypothetical protein
VDPINALGSNLLKVTIGLSALVFIIMLQAHHNHDEATPQSGYITGICHNMAVEVRTEQCSELMINVWGKSRSGTPS